MGELGAARITPYHFPTKLCFITEIKLTIVQESSRQYSFIYRPLEFQHFYSIFPNKTKVLSLAGKLSNCFNETGIEYLSDPDSILICLFLLVLTSRSFSRFICRLRPTEAFERLIERASRLLRVIQSNAPSNAS